MPFSCISAATLKSIGEKSVLCLLWVITVCHDQFSLHFPANTIHSANVGLMLGQRRRRWPNIKPTLAERIVLAGCSYACILHAPCLGSVFISSG